jgi:uncharacterized membrane protein
LLSETPVIKILSAIHLDRGEAMIAAATFMLIFRFLHIVAGVLWVGSVFLFVGFIGPSAAEVAPSGQRLLTAAVKKRKVGRVIAGLAITNVLAGWTMWLRNMSIYGSLGEWVSSRFGLVITIGGVLATIAALLGTLVVGPTVERLIDAGNEIAMSEDPPTVQQRAQVDQLGKRLRKYGMVVLTLLLLTVTAMATASYW